MTKRLIVSAAVLLALVGCARQPATEKAANYVFTNGKIYTVNEVQPWAEAVAVTGKDVVFVGSNNDTEKEK